MILSTYRWPRALSLVLRGYARQTWTGFEVVVADDGSGPATVQVIEEARSELGLRVVHCWQEDQGFRKTEILNRSVLAARGQYLIFSDGDCIPREDFVAQHRNLARRGVFLSGGCVRLPRVLSERLSFEDVDAGRVFDPRWLRAQGWKAGHRGLRLTRSRPLSRILDAATTTRATWNGHNASTWREAILQVNGFDLGMGYGSEDRALGERLRNLGLKGARVRFQAPVVHLYHDRPYKDPEVMRRNREIRERIRRRRETRAEAGIAQLEESTR